MLHKKGSWVKNSILVIIQQTSTDVLFYLFLNMSKRIFIPLLLLLIPVIGMNLTDQINWSIFDFITMGSLLLLVGIGINFVLHKKVKNRSLYIGLIILIFMLLWAELALGVFGSPFAGS